MKKNTWIVQRSVLGWAMACALAGGVHAEDTPPPDVLRAEVRTGLGMIEISLNRPLRSDGERLAIFAGTTDISDLFQSTGVGARLPAGSYVLPQEGRELTVYWINPAGDWAVLIEPVPQQVASAALPALGEAHSQAWQPRFNLGMKAQIAEGHRPDSAAPVRRTYQDLTGSFGLNGSQRMGAGTLGAQMDSLGVSRRAEALRFGTEASAAPKFDLASYNVGYAAERYQIAVGHQVHNGHRLLFSQFDSRGIAAQVRPFQGTELSVAALNGVRIVGFDNLLGLGESSNRVYGLTIGQELLPSRPQTLRLEISALDASRKPESNFNQASVTDAETSRGLGLRLIATAFEQRLRVDGGLARSRFENPDDPLLAQNASLVGVRRESRDARYLDMSYDLLRGVKLSETQQANLTLALRHQRADPLYRTVGAIVQSDRDQNQFELSGNVAAASVQYSYTRGEDNLDEILSILKTLTRVHALNVSLPLAQMQGDEQSSSSWWPTLNYRFDQTHQRGAALPVNSDFALSHVPDQRNRGHQISTDWAAASWRFGYRLGFTRQDNRQIGRERADFFNRNQGIGVGYMTGQSLDVSMELGEDRADSKESALIGVTRRGSFIANWRIGEDLALNGSLSADRTTDNQDQVQAENHTLSLQAAYTFRLKLTAARQIPVQWFLRFAQQRTAYASTVFGIDTDVRLWNVQSGLNISFF